MGDEGGGEIKPIPEEDEGAGGGDTSSHKSRGSEDSGKTKKEEGKGDGVDASVDESDAKTSVKGDEKSEAEDGGEGEIVEGAEEGSEEVAKSGEGKAVDDAGTDTTRQSRLSKAQAIVDSQEQDSGSSDESPERKDSTTMAISQDLSEHLDTITKEDRLKKRSPKKKKKIRAGPMTYSVEDVVITPDDEGIPTYPWEGSCSSSSASSVRDRSSGSERTVQEKDDSREKLIDLYKILTKEKYVLKRKNTVLQKRTSEYFKQRKWEIYTSESLSLEPAQETRYKAYLKQFEDCLEREADVRTKVEVNLAEMENQKFEAEEKQRRMLQNILDREREIGQNLISERTGKPITPKMLDRLLDREVNSIEALRKIRSRYIKIRDAQEAKEIELRKLERLGDGLYLKDYEQLRMENQSYCDKIEERDEELTQLRNRTTSIIQILAHIREKAHDTSKNIADFYEDLEYTEYETMRNRECLSVLKQQRSELRARHKEVKVNAGLLVHKRLVDDFEKCLEVTKKLSVDIKELRRKYAKGLVQLEKLRGGGDFHEMTAAARAILIRGRPSALPPGLSKWLSSNDMFEDAQDSDADSIQREFISKRSDRSLSMRSDQSSVVIAVKRTRPGFFPPLKHFLRDNY